MNEYITIKSLIIHEYVLHSSLKITALNISCKLFKLLLRASVYFKEYMPIPFFHSFIYSFTKQTLIEDCYIPDTILGLPSSGLQFMLKDRQYNAASRKLKQVP